MRDAEIGFWLSSEEPLPPPPAVPCGPDPQPVVAAVAEYVSAGYDHVYLHQVGPDQEGFFRFWERELSPRLNGR